MVRQNAAGALTWTRDISIRGKQGVLFDNFILYRSVQVRPLDINWAAYS